MIKKKTLRAILIIGGLFLQFSLGLSACQSQTEVSPVEPEFMATQPEQPSNGGAQATSEIPASVPVDLAPDPAAIQAAWQSSPHADAFVLDTTGQNNTCARCHAPVNWMPSMDDLPESCFACKFELEDPPPYIPESDWADIPCNVCHEVDRDDNIQPEIAWLEIAPLGEYAVVASPTALCLKCHAPTDIPGHGDIQLGGAHADYECTQCHSAHATTTSCDAENCHSNVVQPATPIAGHDGDHLAVSCVACHDAGGMEVGPGEEQALWTTFITETTDASSNKYAFTSHNIVLESNCDRCHFANNPWALSTIVEEP